METEPVVPKQAQALYAVAPEGFIAARDELAKQLTVEGEAAAAAAVKKLRRPTVAAWAVNQAARTAPQLVDDLLAAGERLAGAQRLALSGKRGTDDMRAATEERRALIRQLTDVAVKALEEAGRPSDTARDDIAGTFEAATLDPAVAELVRAGILDRTVTPSSGLVSVEGLTVLEGGGDGASTPARKAATAAREAEKAVHAADEAQAAADAAAQRSGAARTAADEAARQAEVLAAAARTAEQDAKRLAAEARTARTRAERAVRRLEG
jgi:hypothetical protein